jgi:hypothetical protein
VPATRDEVLIQRWRRIGAAVGWALTTLGASMAGQPIFARPHPSTGVARDRRGPAGAKPGHEDDPS